ncbi:YcaO-like family protein [Sporomusa acidovorans]|uniref:Ribosomal protein S12 methylthiotransferase accessory factor YcaO n=1 Tax=Sporomusa acidovorans (strain ATCC 49682 / DSM 3132 / Mol) TaxID=1123286 RepID=A0ABZ3IXS3_SPOA4|nr:YcaO-like family protein [Sporomusa acidovorans]OZC13055.1 ribosomal protein S12 methylthiotransferase accessory factor YcaO [Sporomusa acidovorans DSM 3132]SDF51009.1 ribosomal protein S12 methylthiotransferase accessory factor [Sporomusa acidovorans]
MTFSTCKYKDDLPLKTITKIRNILTDLNILAVETGWKNSADGFYSVTVTIRNTNLATNGKGTTHEYALASAYAELMERLQNQAFFRLNYDLREDALGYQGFFYAPDEQLVSMEDFLNSNEEWPSIQFNKTPRDTDIQELLQKWQQVSYEKIPADFIALPYLNMNSGRISHIPIKMVSKMYMSNGMCAGNTTEEALVQGLSEVLERYVNMRILVEEITPPDIPLEFLKQHPSIYRMIQEIEKSGNFEVIMKDCSLGQGFPVVAVIFLNKDDQSYFVKFGSHPIFDIAAERTLTELLQGQEVRDMMGTKEFFYRSPVNEDHENVLGILVNGSGYYPTRFFTANYSYDFTEFPAIEADSNKQLLEYLFSLIKGSGHQIFVRDNSFLGFPSFHIIVPGMSEIEQFFDIKPIDEYAKYNKTKEYIRNLPELTQAEADEIIQFFCSIPYHKGSSIANILNLTIKKSLPWYYVKIDLFLSALHYWKGDFVNAYYALERFLDFSRHMQSGVFERGLYNFYKCIRDYFGARADGMEGGDIVTLLSKFYPVPMVQGVIDEFGSVEQFFDVFGYFSCWCCEKCDYSEGCSYIEHEKIYKILKEEYAKKQVNQATLSRLVLP